VSAPGVQFDHVGSLGDDPLPNGLARNRKALEAIIRFAHEQKILPRTIKPEEMFAPNTVNLE
jgi:4,5-dihydroxyphthalate decarboxylase